jgi:hypothetical protein
MTLIRKNITFARTTDAAFFDADGHLDFYMFDRETRMDETWESVAVERMGSDRIQPPTATGERQNNHRIAELLREIAQHKLMLIAAALMLIAVAMVKQWFS